MSSKSSPTEGFPAQPPSSRPLAEKPDHENGSQVGPEKLDEKVGVYAMLKLHTKSTADSPNGSSLSGESNVHRPAPFIKPFSNLGLSAYIYSLDGVTTWSYLAFATSTFGGHSLIASIQTAQSIISKSCSILSPALARLITEYPIPVAVGKPVIAKLSDVTSRPFAYVVTSEFASGFYLTVRGMFRRSLLNFPPTVVFYIVGNCRIPSPSPTSLTRVVTILTPRVYYPRVCP